jgi:hypothetical protein
MNLWWLWELDNGASGVRRGTRGGNACNEVSRC